MIRLVGWLIGYQVYGYHGCRQLVVWLVELLVVLVGGLYICFAWQINRSQWSSIATAGGKWPSIPLTTPSYCIHVIVAPQRIAYYVLRWGLGTLTAPQAAFTATLYFILVFPASRLSLSRSPVVLSLPPSPCSPVDGGVRTPA